MTNTVLSRLAAFFERYPASTYWLAYSGGLDSHVLLHACAQLKKQQTALAIQAIHIDHGLQAASAAWASHCVAICQALQLPLQTIVLNLQIQSGDSLEAVARQARYQAFQQWVQAGDYLLTAHHQDDQAETLLLNLLRGAGVQGLAAMPETRLLGKRLEQGYLGRPLLALSRQDLKAYARYWQLDYIDDPSNTNTAFDRNYLRHTVLPLLAQRWPATKRTLARAAQWQAESRDVLASLLTEQLQSMAGSQAATLSVKALLSHTDAMQKALLRQWLHYLGFSMPAAKKLQHVLQDVLQAKADASPLVSWADCEIRRYRDDVYALKPLQDFDAGQTIAWEDTRRPLWIASLQLELAVEVLDVLRERLQAEPTHIEVRFRRGGEKIYRKGQHSLELKQLMQTAGIPPWQRARLPLVYWGKQLIAVPGLMSLQAEEIN